MSPENAVTLLNDSDWVVRYIAAQRAPTETLPCLLDDPEPDVRAVVTARLSSTAPNEYGSDK